jgi:hypothetical protein
MREALLGAKAPTLFKRLTARLNSLRKNSISRVILGGAALQRCGNAIVLNAALAAEATGLDRKRLFPQPLKSCRSRSSGQCVQWQFFTKNEIESCRDQSPPRMLDTREASA